MGFENDSGGVFRRAVADLVLPSLLLGRFAGSDMMPTASSAALSGQVLSRCFGNGLAGRQQDCDETMIISECL